MNAGDETTALRQVAQRLTAERDALVQERDDLREELEDASATLGRLRDLLTGVANALKGPPPEDSMHDWSDLPQVAEASVRAFAVKDAELRKALEAEPLSEKQIQTRLDEVRRVLRAGEQFVCLCSTPGEPITFGYLTGSSVSIWHGLALRHWFEGQEHGGEVFGYEACWHPVGEGQHCRMPKGHDGDHLPRSR